MKIFDWLFGKKKVAKKKTSSAVSGKKTGTSNVPPRGLVQTTPIKRDTTLRQRQELPTIENLHGVPGYSSVMSLPSGELSFTQHDMVDYLVLRIQEGKNDISVVRSTDKYKSGVDHSYMTIKERIKAKDLNIVTEYLASREIIKLIYDKNAESKLDVKDKSKIINKVDIMLKDALNSKVSDVHIEVRRDGAQVKFRKHGDLYLRHDWPVQVARDVSVVIYQVMAEEKDVSFVAGIVQDAVLDRNLDGKRLRVRIGTIPAAPDGYDMVMRLLPYDENEVQVTIPELGYTEDQQLDIEMGLSKPVGVIVIAGVTGSGKTTSLAAMIREIVSEADGTIKVITVENPPEQFMRGVTQSPVVTRAANTGKSEDTPFAEAMRGALRADPDFLMVGEVRDNPTAKLLIGAVQSGHKVMTTIHAPSGIGIVSRMRSLGIPNDVLGGGDFFSALIYQTLIKTVCPACSFTLSEYQERNAGNVKFEKLLKRLIMTVDDLENSNIRFVNRCGCDECHFGITGRTVVAEVILPDHQMIAYFAAGRDMDAWAHFRKMGGKSALMVGIEKMKLGLLDPYDVEKSLGLMNSEIVMSDGLFNYQEERLYSGERSRDEDQGMGRRIPTSEPVKESEAFMEMDEPNSALASMSDFNSDLLSERLKLAEVIPFGSRKVTEDSQDTMIDTMLDPTD